MVYIKYEAYSLYVYCSSQKDVLSRRNKAEIVAFFEKANWYFFEKKYKSWPQFFVFL
jgi:hypothetical protein